MKIRLVCTAAETSTNSPIRWRNTFTKISRMNVSLTRFLQVWPPPKKGWKLVPLVQFCQDLNYFLSFFFSNFNPLDWNVCWLLTYSTRKDWRSLIYFSLGDYGRPAGGPPYHLGQFTGWEWQTWWRLTKGSIMIDYVVVFCGRSSAAEIPWWEHW